MLATRMRGHPLNLFMVFFSSLNAKERAPTGARSLLLVQLPCVPRETTAVVVKVAGATMT